MTYQSMDYYSIKIDRPVDKITIVLTSIAGDANLFASLYNTYPSINDFGN